MGDVIQMTFPQATMRPDRRRDEVSQLCALIESRAVEFRSGESERVAGRLNDTIGQFAASSGETLRTVCKRIWPLELNPAKRRRELLALKKARALLEYARRIAVAVDIQPDDLLLEAFRDTRFDEEANARLAGKKAPHDFDQCWRTLSETFHSLAAEISRTAQLGPHQLLGATVAGNYDLADGSIRPARNAIVRGSLANWSVHNEEYPLMPSVVLFQAPLTEGIECMLIADQTGYAQQVTAKMLREVRLAIGPADSLKPEPLFEFRSLLSLENLDGAMPVLRPWHDLENKWLTVQIDGSWQDATLGLPDGFTAELETDVQFVHQDIAWRAVTAATCRDVLSRSEGNEIVPWSAAASSIGLCPPRSVGAEIEAVLLSGPDSGLIAELRADAHRVVELLRAWQARQVTVGLAAHEDLRASWKTWP